MWVRVYAVLGNGTTRTNGYGELWFDIYTLLTFVVPRAMASEIDLASILCSLLLNGETETRHDYVANGQNRYTRVDCETETHVVEVGLDNRRSSYDSLHQALFAASLTEKLPMVVIIDTNGVEEAEEFQVRSVAKKTGVSYLTVDKDFLVRWQMTVPFRQDQTIPLFGR